MTLEVYLTSGETLTIDTEKQPLTISGEERVIFEFSSPYKDSACFNFSAITGYSIFRKE